MRLAAACLTLFVLGTAHAETTPRTYTVLLLGNRAGVQSCTSVRAETRCTFSFNDRGRGPALETTFAVGRDSIPVRIAITGHNYLKDRVDESFVFEKGRARWKSTVEAGEASLAAPALYLPFDAVPEADAVLVRALRAAKGNALPLLPAGEARLEGSSRLDLSVGGRTRSVTRFDVVGLGLEAQHVFLDEHGDLFASGGSWLLTIREGWEGAAPALLASQESADVADSARRTRALARTPGGPLAFRGVGVFDADAAQVRPGMTVVVSGGRIAAVGADGTVAIPSGAEIVEGRGRTLLPGLFDMHVHMTSDVDGILDLASGVTTVRDLGNDLPEITSRKERFESGAAVGPRVLTSVLVDGPGPFAGPTKFLVSTEADGAAAVDACVKAGCTELKIYSSIKLEGVPALVLLAHAKGIRASGHVPAFMTAEDAVKDGFDEIHHVNFLFLNFLFDEVKDTRSPERFTAVVRHAAEVDLGSSRVRDFVRLLQVRGVVVDPTVVTFEDLFLSRPGIVPEAWTGIADRLPPQVRRTLLGGGLPVGEGGEKGVRASFEALLKMVRLLHEGGVRLVAGTDGFAGFCLPRELELYVSAGIPAPEVLQIATIGAARVANLADDVGTIAAGKRADLVLVDGNPAVRISDIRKVSLVVKNGVVFDPAALLASIGVRP